MVKVLFVCLGNICRSPLAAGVFRRLVVSEGLEDRIAADSAGTHGYHVGEAPDERARAAARRRGIDIGGLSARRVRRGDFTEFDYVLAMDRGNYRELVRLCPPGAPARLGLYLDFAPDLGGREVPDPYYGGADGFERVLDMVEAAAHGLITHIRRSHV